MVQQNVESTHMWTLGFEIKCPMHCTSSASETMLYFAKALWVKIQQCQQTDEVNMYDMLYKPRIATTILYNA